MGGSVLDEVLFVTHMTEDEFRLELAIMFYEREKVSMGWVADFLGVGRVTFQHLLASREVTISYDEAAYEQDLAAIRAYGQRA
jgi:predicted HTH domain antitoxin